MANKMPSALTPQPRFQPPVVPVGIRGFDETVHGGLPTGAITELVGPESSGRTTVALSALAGMTRADAVCAWVDVDDVLDPESVARSGVDWMRLLWVRCGSPSPAPVAALSASEPSASHLHPAGPPAPKSGGSPHPRSESRGMPQAVHDLLLAQPRSAALPDRRLNRSIGTPGVPNRALTEKPSERKEQTPFDRLPPRRGDNLAITPCCSESLPPRRKVEGVRLPSTQTTHPPLRAAQTGKKANRLWTPLDQALRATDLLLQSGGFQFIVLDLGSTPADISWRIPLATWFRFRAACERTRATLLLLTQHPCARSSAELVVRMETGRMEAQARALTGVSYRASLERRRFQSSPAKVVSIRKPPQPECPGEWKRDAAWAI